ncbi:MAG: DUF4252 domain-containing protein [Alloprevotella sp.]
MKKIVSILILSLLPILAWAEGDYYDFSKLRQLKGVESVYISSQMTKTMKSGKSSKVTNMNMGIGLPMENVDSILILTTEQDAALGEFKKVLKTLRKKSGYQALAEHMEDDEETYIIVHPKAGSTTEYDEMIIFNLEAHEGRIVQLIGTLDAPGK